MKLPRNAAGLIAVCLAGSLLSARAQMDFTPLTEVVEAELRRNQLPGCAVAVVVDGRLAFSKGFGTTCIEEGRTVTADTLFRIGSTTKMFTAAAVVGLAEEGKLDLHKPVGDYVKGLDPKLARATAHQLLTHTAGFNDPNASYGPHDDRALGEGLRARDGRVAFFEPGEIYSYSNIGYWLAGLLAEEVAGKPYADVVKERLLTPAGMTRSTFRPTEVMTWPFAVGHEPEGRGPPGVVRPLADNAAVWPAGQLFTTANEFARWCRAFMDGGKLDGKQVLSPRVIRELSTPHVPVPGDDRHYGYGLSVRQQNGLTWLSHTGSRLGYGSQARLCPEKQFAVIILCNKTGLNLPRVADKAVELALGIQAPAAESGERKSPSLTEADLRRFAGKYSNGLTTVELVARDGKLFGSLGGEVTRTGESSFVRAATPLSEETAFQLVGDDNGRAKYLMRRGRAMKRVE